jgi:transposase
MHYKDKLSRDQLMVMSYDTMIAPDNAVRLIDLMCKKFIKDHPLEIKWKGMKNEGRKSYPPVSMLALLVYGYFNGIASSRKLERETYRNIEVLWLMEGLQPDHWTICEFRRESETIMKIFLKAFRRFLLEGSYAQAERIVFDGTKVKAYARREMLTIESIKEKLTDIDKSITEYLSKIEKNDTQDNTLELAKAEIEALKEKIKILESKKDKLKYAENELKKSGEKYYAPNDTDAKLMKGRDGKYPGYNAQVGVETKGHFILSERVTTEATDLSQLQDNVKNVEKETGILPTEVSADKGFANTTQIIEIETNGVTQCYIPLIETQREKEEKEGITFQYNKEKDVYICPQGFNLQLHAKNRKQKGRIYNIYKCHECNNCKKRSECTNSKTGRILKRNINQDEIDKYKEKMAGVFGKKKIAERKCVVEHPFGTIKSLMGKNNLLLTGKNKVQIEFDYYTTAYNLKRIFNLVPFQQLFQEINKYKWEIV